MTTYRELASELTAVGFLTPEAARLACDALARRGLLDADEAEHHLPGMLHELGAAVEVHTDDVDVDVAAN